MININEFKRQFEFLANKSQRGNSVSPDEFNRLVQRAYMEYIMSIYGNHREYQPGAPLPRVAYEITHAVMDRLSFLKENPVMRVDATGRVNIPDGVTVKDLKGTIPPAYMNFSSLRCFYKTNVDCKKVLVESKDVSIIRDDEWAKRLDSKIVPPENKYPIATFYNGYIQVAPAALQQVQLTYLRQPKAPVWGYVMNQQGRADYDADTSVDFECPDLCFNEIMVRCLAMLGINMRDTQLAQYSEAMKQQGV